MRYVAELSSEVQKTIRKDLEQSIRAEGIYTEDEIQEAVQNGMDSKLDDLSDTIDISKYK